MSEVNNTTDSSLTATTTIQGHVAQALEFYSKDNIYLSIGKTSEWKYDENIPYTDQSTNDKNPPEADPSGTLLELVGIKKISQKFLVYPSDEGELIDDSGFKWKITDKDHALENGACYVYLKAELGSSDLPTGISYRQISALVDPTIKSGITPSDSYEVDNIESTGTVYAIFNRDPVPREKYQGETISVIIEF